MFWHNSFENWQNFFQKWQNFLVRLAGNLCFEEKGKGWELTLCPESTFYETWALGNPMPELTLTPLDS